MISVPVEGIVVRTTGLAADPFVEFSTGDEPYSFHASHRIEPLDTKFHKGMFALMKFET